MLLHKRSEMQAEVNMLIKAAHDRRQNFREAQRKVPPGGPHAPHAPRPPARVASQARAPRRQTLLEYEMKRRETSRGEMGNVAMGKQS